MILFFGIPQHKFKCLSPSLKKLSLKEPGLRWPNSARLHISGRVHTAQHYSKVYDADAWVFLEGSGGSCCSGGPLKHDVDPESNAYGCTCEEVAGLCVVGWNRVDAMLQL